MVVEGDSSTFEDNMEEILGISADDTPAFKAFLQQVEDMDLTIEGVKTFISRNEKGELEDCLHWNINIDYSLQSLANVESSLEADSQLCL